MIAVVGDITRHPLTRTFETWNSRSGPFAVGPFTVTPILTDHSAFDAYMLLIDGAGKTVLYTGDFRRHGRKSVFFDRMMAKPPVDIDVLLCEVTNLGSDKPVKTELFNRTRGRVFEECVVVQANLGGHRPTGPFLFVLAVGTAATLPVEVEPHHRHLLAPLPCLFVGREEQLPYDDDA